MPRTKTLNIENIENRNVANFANQTLPSESELDFVLQNIEDSFEDFDLKGMPELKLTRQNGKIFGKCGEVSADYGW